MNQDQGFSLLFKWPSIDLYDYRKIYFGLICHLLWHGYVKAMICSHLLDTSKMKFAPLGSSLKSNPNTSFGEAVKITHTFTMIKWFDHICFEYT